ncbi:MAG: hypothetical protein SGPRY_010841 [Prymnesium sp.]
MAELKRYSRFRQDERLALHLALADLHPSRPSPPSPHSPAAAGASEAARRASSPPLPSSPSPLVDLLAAGQNDQLVALRESLSEVSAAADAAMAARLESDASVAHAANAAEIAHDRMCSEDRRFAERLCRLPEKQWAASGDTMEHGEAGRMRRMAAQVKLAELAIKTAAAELPPRLASPRPPVVIDLEQPEERPSAPHSSKQVAATGEPTSLHSRKRKVRVAMCLICFDEVEEDACVTAQHESEPSSSGAASSSKAAGGACGHNVCRNCMREYITRQVNERKRKVVCCQVGCDAIVSFSLCSELLGSSSRALMQLQHSLAEATIVNKMYCPNRRCSAAFEAPRKEDKGYPMSKCPYCRELMCVSCAVPWHTDLSCEQFQNLPAHLRDQGDLALLRVARQKQLRACPRCNELIERHEGDCNHVRCRCGGSFCYACGVPYLSDKPTASNLHGQPGCSCGLWTGVIPHDNVADVAAVAVAPVQPRGRCVRCQRNQCAHSCPHQCCGKCCTGCDKHYRNRTN